MMTITKTHSKMVNPSVGEWAARTAGEHGNSLGVSICANATAYEEIAVTTTS